MEDSEHLPEAEEQARKVDILTNLSELHGRILSEGALRLAVKSLASVSADHLEQAACVSARSREYFSVAALIEILEEQGIGREPVKVSRGGQPGVLTTQEELDRGDLGMTIKEYLTYLAEPDESRRIAMIERREF